MKQRTFPREAAYILGLLILAAGTALMERADFGMSMIVAPAYILHLKLSLVFPFFTFGMAEYCLQALLLLLMIAVLRQFRVRYLFSFATAVLYGLLLDGAFFALSLIPEAGGLPVRFIFYLSGMICCSSGVSLLFQTYISPEVYELFVKELSDKYHLDIYKCKTVYDCVSCGIAVILSFAFFGLWHFEGVKWGTILCALLNGAIIGLWTRLWTKCFVFEDKLPLRRFFR